MIVLRSRAVNQDGSWGDCRIIGPAVALAVEVSETCSVAVPPFGFTDDGETAQVEPVGAPAQLKLMIWLNPPLEFSVMT